MQPGLVTCSQCKAILGSELFNTGRLEICPSCKAQVRLEVFPALYTTQTVGQVQAPTIEGESSCFYHTAKKAVVVCDLCGRFLCGLCDLDLNNRHVCPSCLESGKKQGKLTELQDSRVLYDRMALAVAVLPMLCFWTSLVGAPIALYIAIRYWNAPCGITGKARWMYILAIILALIEIVFWIFFFGYMSFAPHR